MLKTIMLSGLTAAMIAFPVSAATPTPSNPAASLSITSAARVPAAPSRSQKLAGPGAIVGLALGAAVALAGVILIVGDNDDSDSN